MSASTAQEPGFHGRLGFGSSPAVIVVDMCQAYFTAGSPLDLGSTVALDGCVALVESARRASIPVLWSRVEFEKGGADGGVFYRKVAALASFDAGNPLGHWLPALVPNPDETVITKQGASAFFGTKLADHLQAGGIDTLIIAGVSTSGCVRATAVDACQHNVVPIVVADACGDRAEATHQSALFDVDAKYGDVVALAEVVAHLSGG